ncbi:hypothetical protein NG99_22495 [Erwinia typographi]|uniref:Uncharacterized protein n=1 Tax=Erwinia typographi TaxID=371042 RepID=A0A0A3YRH9_9GAMM|nr:hypothetical protein [Erwinia typographi]KGT87931.1 hypothetical protein NG99_22495 [Erwinia typographi]
MLKLIVTTTLVLGYFLTAVWMFIFNVDLNDMGIPAFALGEYEASAALLGFAGLIFSLLPAYCLTVEYLRPGDEVTSPGGIIRIWWPLLIICAPAAIAVFHAQRDVDWLGNMGMQTTFMIAPLTAVVFAVIIFQRETIRRLSDK